MTERDPFAYDTGLPEGPGTFTNVRFTNDPAVQEGQVLLLKADIQFDDPDVGEHEARWKCGDKFETNDGGKTAERIDGSNKNFHERSGAALLGISMLKTDAEKVLRERYSEDNLTPRHAAYYEGLKFNFINKRYSGKINNDEVEWTVLEVDEFLGVNGGEKKAAAPAKKAAGAAKKAAAPAATTPDEGGISEEARQKAFDIAYNAADEESYVAEAMEALADEMTPELEAAIGDVGEGSIWHEAVEKYNADNA